MQGDVTNASDLETAFARHNYLAVLHFAALKVHRTQLSWF
jgi:UDP-glucose 4-epimerase